MDPTQNLTDQISAAEAIVNDDSASHTAHELAKLVLALHDWIAKGGFLPAQWCRYDTRKDYTMTEIVIRLSAIWRVVVTDLNGWRVERHVDGIGWILADDDEDAPSDGVIQTACRLWARRLNHLAV